MSKSLDFKLDQNDKKSFIKSVKLSSDTNTAVIVVDYNMNKDYIISWDIAENKEIDLFEVGKIYQIIWDLDGVPYIVEKDSVLFTNQMINVTAYDVKDSIELLQKSPNT